MTAFVIAPGNHGSPARKKATTAQVKVLLDHMRADPEVVLIVCTEHYTDEWRKAYNAPGWEWIRLGQCLITWRISYFPEHSEGHEDLLTEVHWFTTKGRPQTMKVTRIRLATKGGKVWRIRAGHMPSHVEQGSRFRPRGVVNRVLTYQAAMKAWRRMVTRINREHPDDELALICDWNLNHHNPAWRRYLARYLPGLHCPDLPSGGVGDEGSRLVTVGWCSQPTRLTVLRRFAGHDHRPVKQEIEP